MKLVKLTDAQADFVFHLLNCTNSYHDHELPFMADVAEYMRGDGHDDRRASHVHAIMNAVTQLAEDC